MVKNSVKSRTGSRTQAKMPRGASYGAKGGKRQLADMDDGILDSDSEEDEFANDAGPSRSRSARDEAVDQDEDEDEADQVEDDEEEEEEGVGAWAPDDWDDEASDLGSEDGSDLGDAAGSGSEEDDGAVDRDSLRRLQKDLNALPLASVLKAQKALTKANRRQYDGDDDQDDESDAGDRPSRAGPSQTKAQKVAEMKARLADLQRSKGRNVAAATASYGEAAQLSDEDDEGDDSAPETSGTGHERGGRTVPRGQVAHKRDSKHAPTALSSKKQVSRNRQVVEVKKVDRRDPRFSTLSTGTSSQPNRPISASTYSFLPSLLTSEFEQLKTAHALAKKAEMTCRLADKPGKTAERERIEKELARVRTRVERMKREEREKAVLSQYNKEERQKREQGKGAWYLKKSEKKDLLLKARFQSLEEEGGKHAVKKALDKKRRKVAAKEKKSRPFAPGQGGGPPRDGAKRRRVG